MSTAGSLVRVVRGSCPAAAGVTERGMLGSGSGSERLSGGWPSERMRAAATAIWSGGLACSYRPVTCTSRALMDELLPLLDAWRIMRLGTREVVDGLVAPRHQGPSPELRKVLAGGRGGWDWAEPGRQRITLTHSTAEAKPPRWSLHAFLFAVTIVCSLGAGAALAGVWYPFNAPGFAGVFTAAARFFTGVGLGDWRLLGYGWTFAVPLLGILLVHESGHYVAARRYDIDASPPFFLPIPPTLSPIGSLGAFIRLRSPVLARRQLLDVGAAGPLAGFVVAVAVLVWGYRLSEVGVAPPLGVIGHSAIAGWVEFAEQPIGLGESLRSEERRVGEEGRSRW